jgi:eukaryotic-like serine/threonine-protein kinase
MKIAVIILAVVAIVAAGLAGFAIWRLDSGVKVPALVGDSAANAKADLSSAGLSYVQEATYSDTTGKGTVARQDPAAGAKASKGGSVTIWVSQGAQKVAVPDVVGTTVAQADATMSGVDLNASAVAGSSGGVPEGQVFKTVPTAGTQVPRGSVITVYYNSTSPTVATPALTGLTEAQASSRLRQAGLLLGAVGTQSSKTARIGTVVSQSVPAGQPVARGSRVSVVLASGSSLVIVPDVLNMPYRQAESELNAQGFGVSITWSPGGGMEPDAVIKVNPPVGTPVPAGSLIVLTVESAS